MVSLRIPIYVTPGARRTVVGGGHAGALRVRVQSRAVGGAATEAALSAVADAFGISRRDVSLEFGKSRRSKLVTLSGNDQILMDRLRVLMCEEDQHLGKFR